jgi:hypothetical protein
VALLLLMSPAQAQIEMPRSVLAGGGGDMAGSHVLRCTVGQPALGSVSDGDLLLESGFWSLVFATWTPVEEAPPGAPAASWLGQNHPNPFNPVTVIPFGVPRESQVRIALYDVEGRFLDTLAEARYPAGNHTLRVDASRWASGVYFYRMRAGEFVETRKLILLK